MPDGEFDVNESDMKKIGERLSCSYDLPPWAMGAPRDHCSAEKNSAAHQIGAIA